MDHPAWLKSTRILATKTAALTEVASYREVSRVYARFGALVDSERLAIAADELAELAAVVWDDAATYDRSILVNYDRGERSVIQFSASDHLLGWASSATIIDETKIDAVKIPAEGLRRMIETTRRFVDWERAGAATPDVGTKEHREKFPLRTGRRARLAAAAEERRRSKRLSRAQRV